MGGFKAGGKGKAPKGKAGKGAGKMKHGKPNAVAKMEEDDDDDDEVVDGTDADFEALRAAILQHVASADGPVSTGRVGYDLGVKKKACAAALFQLKDQMYVTFSEGIPPKWTATSRGQSNARQDATVPDRYTYDPDKKKISGPRPQHGDFETLKNLLQNRLAAEGGGGMTAGKLGFDLDATKKAINGALYSLQKDGVAWQVGENETGFEKIRWAASPGPIMETDEIPEAYRYANVKRAIAAQGGGAQKKVKLGIARSKEEDFEILKLISQVNVAQAGEHGISSGQLGHRIGAGRKHITAALYSCMGEGAVENVSPDGKPRWKCLEFPPDDFECPLLPPRYAYISADGDDDDDDGAVTLRTGMHQLPAYGARMPAKAGKAGGGKAGQADDFETLKLVIRAKLSHHGDGGASSGKLGFELGANRKAITAALHSCMEEGSVQNTNDEGRPHWVSVLEPPRTAASLSLPPRFGYAGKGGGDEDDEEVAGKGNNAKKKKAKSQGGGMANQQVIENAVSAICMWGQKNMKKVGFRDLGVVEGGFACEVVVDDQDYPAAVAPNKKEAKRLAAETACNAIGIPSAC